MSEPPPRPHEYLVMCINGPARGWQYPTFIPPEHKMAVWAVPRGHGFLATCGNRRQNSGGPGAASP